MAYNALHKLESNTEAIRIALEWDGRSTINASDRISLEKYSGFGGIKAILYGDGSEQSWIRQGASQADIRLYAPMQKFYDLLRKHLGQKQYKEITQSLRSSILTAFYTPEVIPSTLFGALKRQEISPVNIYEPSAGVGIFINHALKTFPTVSQVTAVEKDLLTGKVLQALTSQGEIPVKVHIKGFEETPTGDNGKYNLIVSNIPFGNFAVYDPDFANRELSGKIHNYFFAKGLDKLSDGGLLAYITTDGFLNSPSNSQARDYLFDRADFISLSVMPDNLMHETGGTQAPSHLLIVQKNSSKTALSEDEGLLTQTVSDSNSYGTYHVNRYVKHHPEILVGNQIKEGTDQYGKAHQVVWQNGDIGGIEQKLTQLITGDLAARYNPALLKPALKIIPVAPTGKTFTFLPVPAVLTQALPVQMGLFDTLPVQSSSRGADYLSETDAKLVDKKTARIIAVVKTKERPDHESIVLLTAKAVNKPFYNYKLYSNVAEISLPQRWMNGASLNLALKQLAIELKKYQYNYLYEGDKTLQTNFNLNSDTASSIKLAKPFYKEGTLVFDGERAGKLGRINENLGEAQFEPIEYLLKNRDIYKGYIGIRDAYLELIEKEAALKEPQHTIRESLNSQYEDFVLAYGQLNSPSNRKLILEDSMGLTILSSVELQQDQHFAKADILTRSQFKKPEAFRTDDVIEALARCLNDKGKVDMPFIALATDMDSAQVIKRLEGHIFLNPATFGWETRDQYLSGNVVEKLRSAQTQAHLNDAQLQKSLEAISRVQPEKIPFELLDFNLGERWIPLNFYDRFASNLFDKETKISYFDSLDTFKVESKGFSLKTQREYAVSPKSGRSMYGETILEHALENTAPFFTYEVERIDGSKARIPDNEAIQLANQKIESIRSAFQNWLKELPLEDKKHLEKLYNDTFNCFVLREYDGSHLRFPGLDKKALGIDDLYSSQKNAAWRIIQNRGALIDHEVGLGKTLTMIIAAHEMKRLGIASKPMILALKANVNQITETYRKAYPSARVLAPGENDFSPDKRQRLFHEIKNNDWDCVVLTHDQFGKIPQSPELQREIFQTELDHVEKDLKTVTNLGGDISKSMLKGLEIRKKNLGVRLLELEKNIEEKKDTGIDFKSMGVDHLFVDESHKFKNLTFTTRHNRVAGLGNMEGSQKALNMLFAVRTLQEKFDADQCVTFLSGTPISNSLTEMYLLFKYLRPKEMQRQRIENFDGWAAVFARKTVDFEFSVTNEIIAKERFRHFIKVPELALFYNEITDYKTAKHINLDKPELDEKLVNIKPTPDQEVFIKNLMHFAQTGDGTRIGRGRLSPQEDKGRMLIATNYAKKMAADLRLVDDARYEDHPGNKVNTCAEKVAQIYHQSSMNRGTQIIFSDIGTPPSGQTKEGFNIYDALKQKLTKDYNIPQHQISYIHDWTDKSKPELFKRMNSGDIRILIGSTEKAGTGLNVQKRIVAMHHMDIPWRPSDLEQRNGRGARQGNMIAKEFYENKVQNFIYAVEQSLDNYKFNLLKNKQTFISQMKNSSLHVRTIDEGAGDEKSGMNFSEYIALLSGDTSLLEKSKLEKKVAVLESLKSAHYKESTRSRFQLDRLVKEKIETMETLRILKADEAVYKGNLKFEKDGTKANSLELSGLREKTSEATGNHILSLYQNWKPRAANQDNQRIGKLYGFDLFIRTNQQHWEDERGKLRFESYNSLYAQRDGSEIKYTFNKGHPNTENPKLSARYFLNAIDRVTSAREQTEKQLAELDKSTVGLEKLSKKPFEKEQELADLKNQLSNLEREIAIKIQLKKLDGTIPQENNDKEIKETNVVPLNQQQEIDSPRRKGLKM
ncbi:helicase-related protein [Dyadobacter frigoris]|uniref:DNA methylase n=1 Tax=Dyadobacter frigoris TaxID=2576211 RepID=A0A4U6CNP5_9BACT|nr:helicase-related protein [Dyadobacter frigoris]TKT86009.1 DNA methylase [Dyadobacter frigoris]